jgi:hypothetical protein
MTRTAADGAASVPDPRLPGRSDGPLRLLLQDALARELASPPTVVEVRRREPGPETSFATEVLSVELSDGRTLQVLLKDYGRSRLPKEDLASRCERERRVYRELLRGAGLDTPTFHGDVWDGWRRWLLLEHVETRDLRSFGLETWLEAAAWLGRLHGRFAARGDLQGRTFLLRHDAAFFAGCAEAALAAVGRVSAALAARLGRALEGYDRSVRIMAEQPRTLVHGSFRPQNILVATEPGAGGGRRIFAVDWELAALGAPLYDLAFLAEGFRDPDLGALIDAYRAEADPRGVPLPGGGRGRGAHGADDGGLRRVLDCFRMHKIAKSLAGATALRFARGAVERYVEMARELRDPAT